MSALFLKTNKETNKEKKLQGYNKTERLLNSETERRKEGKKKKKEKKKNDKQTNTQLKLLYAVVQQQLVTTPTPSAHSSKQTLVRAGNRDVRRNYFLCFS